jgi:hypothetical protein
MAQASELVQAEPALQRSLSQPKPMAHLSKLHPVVLVAPEPQTMVQH